jgi:hypothetical protein
MEGLVLRLVELYLFIVAVSAIRRGFKSLSIDLIYKPTLTMLWLGLFYLCLYTFPRGIGVLWAHNLFYGSYLLLLVLRLSYIPILLFLLGSKAVRLVFDGKQNIFLPSSLFLRVLRLLDLPIRGFHLIKNILRRNKLMDAWGRVLTMVSAVKSWRLKK